MGIWSLMSMTCICTSQIVWKTAREENKQCHSNPSAKNNFALKEFTVCKSEHCQIAWTKQSPAVVRTWFLASHNKWKSHSVLPFTFPVSSTLAHPVSFPSSFIIAQLWAMPSFPISLSHIEIYPRDVLLPCPLGGPLDTALIFIPARLNFRSQ